MKLIKNFITANTDVQDETLSGLTLDRMLVFAAGCEQRTLGNVANYDPALGKITFLFPLGNVQCVVLIIS